MKSVIAASTLLGISALSSASPVKRQNTCIVQTVINPSTDDVAASINQWNNDVITVNAFLNNADSLIAANDPDALTSAAMTALNNAQDEPCQLMTLASQPDFSTGPPAFTCAVQDLMNVFGTHVLDNLMTIIANPADTDSVQMAVDDINAFRCCNVLPDAEILWLDSAADNGIADQVPIAAQRENACANIQCTPFCRTQDNGSFGK